MSDTPRACLNCATPLTGGEYCPACGQRNRHARLRATEIAADLSEQFLEWRLPWLRTLFELAWRPGAVALDYVEGKRARYVNPAKYLFVVAAILLASRSAGDPDWLLDVPQYVVVLLTFPVETIFLHCLFFRSSKTATETSVLCAYLTAQSLIFMELIHALDRVARRTGLAEHVSPESPIPLIAILGVGLVGLYFVAAIRIFYATSVYRALIALCILLPTSIVVGANIEWLLRHGRIA